MMADTAASPRRSGGRLASIDAMRGLVMLLMTLDHVRGDFTAVAQRLWRDASVLPANPLELETTTPTFFLMRWVTHLCAPTFVFLAGTSVNFWMLRHGRERSVGRYLLTRGAMILGINMALGLHAPFSSARLLVLGVLWAIGCSMLLLALVVRLPRALSWCLALLLVAGHDALRGYIPEGEMASVLWRLAFVRTYFEVPGVGAVYALYTVLPWFGLMWLGYLCGGVFRMEVERRRRLLSALGAGCLALFALLRLSGGYGDPTSFMAQSTGWRTMASFVNVGKYPPTLQFTLLTLGVMWLLLAWFERGRRLELLCVPGRAPLAYYVLHIICIRGLAAVLALMPEPIRGASFSAMGVVAFSVLVFAALYPVCSRIGLWRAGGYRMSGGAPA